MAAQPPKPRRRDESPLTAGERELLKKIAEAKRAIFPLGPSIDPRKFKHDRRGG